MVIINYNLRATKIINDGERLAGVRHKLQQPNVQRKFSTAELPRLAIGVGAATVPVPESDVGGHPNLPNPRTPGRVSVQHELRPHEYVLQPVDLSALIIRAAGDVPRVRPDALHPQEPIFQARSDGDRERDPLRLHGRDIDRERHSLEGLRRCEPGHSHYKRSERVFGQNGLVYVRRRGLLNVHYYAAQSWILSSKQNLCERSHSRLFDS